MTTAFRYLLLGKMSMLQFCMLMVICEHADWDRLTANGMSADLFIKELEPLGLIPDGNPKTRRKYVRRAARGLRDQGWYTWDWNPGDTRPYNVFLPTSAELSLLSIAFRVNVHEEGGVKDTKIPPETVQNVHEQATENVHEKSQQKPIETPVSQGRLFENVHEQTTENVHEDPSWTNAPELSLTDHKDTNRRQEKKKTPLTLSHHRLLNWKLSSTTLRRKASAESHHGLPRSWRSTPALNLSTPSLNTYPKRKGHPAD